MSVILTNMFYLDRSKTSMAASLRSFCWRAVSFSHVSGLLPANFLLSASRTPDRSPFQVIIWPWPTATTLQRTTRHTKEFFISLITNYKIEWLLLIVFQCFKCNWAIVLDGHGNRSAIKCCYEGSVWQIAFEEQSSIHAAVYHFDNGSVNVHFASVIMMSTLLVLEDSSTFSWTFAIA